MKKTLCLLLFISSIVFGEEIECYDGSNWREVSTEIIEKLGKDVYSVKNFRYACREVYEAQIAYQNRNNNKEESYTETVGNESYSSTGGYTWVNGHYRHYKSGKVGYVRGHYRKK